MNLTKNKAVIYNAIIWAAMIIATAQILSKESTQVESTLLILQVIGWYSTNLIMTKNSSVKEWHCIQRTFQKLKQAR